MSGFPNTQIRLLLSLTGLERLLQSSNIQSIHDDVLTAPVLAKEPPPPSPLRALIHPRAGQVSAEVDAYFLKHWPFANEKDMKKFRAAGFSRVTCLYYPVALNDRIHFACRLLTVLFLIDDLLEDMSFEEGSAYNERLIPISRGDVLPDRNVPVEYITYDLWESMRECDKPLADSILEPVFTFMRAQTDKSRLTIQTLGKYLEYRERDVGKAYAPLISLADLNYPIYRSNLTKEQYSLLSALMRFVMKLDLTEAELETAKPLEQNCSKHISVLNDIYSWEKELAVSQAGNQEGSAVCSSVQIMANEANLSYDASKRVLWVMCRQWERVHEELAVQMEGSSSKALMEYIQGFEYQMSGNERWSESTPRYHC